MSTENETIDIGAIGQQFTGAYPALLAEIEELGTVTGRDAVTEVLATHGITFDPELFPPECPDGDFELGTMEVGVHRYYCICLPWPIGCICFWARPEYAAS